MPRFANAIAFSTPTSAIAYGTSEADRTHSSPHPCLIRYSFQRWEQLLMNTVRAMLGAYLRTRIMLTLVEEFLDSFDRLPDSERIEVALEILKRVIHIDFPSLSDEDLVLNAEGIFLELDKQESAYE